MAITTKSSFMFKSQQALNYISGYYVKKLIWTRLGLMTLKNDFNRKTGDTIDVPYFPKLSPAEKGQESVAVTVDSLGDRFFQGTVYEINKAVGITDSGKIRRGSTEERWEEEKLQQIGRVMAELTDSDALAVLNNDGTSDTDGATGNEPKGHDLIDNVPATITLSTAFGADKGINDATVVPHKMNIQSLFANKLEGFGDRANEVIYSIMHSKHYSNLVTDGKAGFLQADANSPYNAMNGYLGNLLGAQTFFIDNTAKGKKVTITDSAGVSQKYQTYKQFFLKKHAYSMLLKQDSSYESARDILKREDMSVASKWYAFISLHKRISDDDKRALGTTYLTNEQTT